MLEVEVKFYLNNVETFRNRILEIGAVSQGKYFENNIRYDNRQKEYFQKRCMIRLRKDNKNTLTLKIPVQNTDNQYKIFKELEVEVSDFSTMNQILEQLGYVQIQRYEKWRESFTLGDAYIVIDSMPYGDFLEIEGKPEDIRKIADQIPLKWEKRILTSYLAMFSILKEKEKFPFDDLIFENFKLYKFDITPFLPLFEVGTL